MPRCSALRVLLVLLALVVVGSVSTLPLLAAPLEKLTVERIHSDPALSGNPPQHLLWHPDGKRLTFLRRAGAGEAQSLFALDVARGGEQMLVDGTKLQAPGEPPRPLPLTACSWLADGNTLLVPALGDVFTVDVRTGAVRALLRTKEDEQHAEASPDGRRVAFVRGNDLFVVDVASGRETRLTQGGSDTLLNGKLDWVYEEELASRSGRAFVWSPDSSQLAYLQLDQARVPTFPIVDFVPVRNEVEWQRYPKAGAPNAIVRVGVVGIARDGRAGPERLVSFEPDDVYVLPQLGWTPDSRGVAFQHLNRAQNQLELRLLPVPEAPADPLGTPRTILREQSKAWLNTFEAPRFLKDGRRFLWMSERDGFAHVYLCELSGACRAVTQGRGSWTAAPPSPAPVRACCWTSAPAFSTSPRPRRIRASGTCTASASTARAACGSRARTAPIAAWFRPTDASTPTPGRTSRRRRAWWWRASDGTRRFVLDENGRRSWPTSAAASSGSSSRPRTARRSTARCSSPWTSIRRGAIRWSSASTAGRTPRPSPTPGAVSPRDSLLASHGFLVFKLDNRGMAGRGTAFECPRCTAPWARPSSLDQLDGVGPKSLPSSTRRASASTGWSYGGYMTLYALTHAPEAFRSAWPALR